MSVQQSTVVRFATELGFDPHEVEQIVVEPKSIHVTLRSRPTEGGGYRTVTHSLPVVPDAR